MSRSLFGTDGVRGRANSDPMTAEIAMRIGMAAGLVFNRGGHRHRAVIGKDTRLSGYMIEQALTAGFLSVGIDVLLLGPIPTPAVGFLTRSMRADVGVMISASHNPFEDNGIKLFGPDGFKLSDTVEDEIQKLVVAPSRVHLAAPSAIGRAKRMDDSEGRYIEAVKASAARGLDLSNLKIVVDCANGAAYKVAPTVLWELGAEVIPVAVTPDGFNINGDCGSTHPAMLQEHVIAHHADVGIALDGDADRVVLVCEHGRLVDGDQLMATIAEQWKRDGRLTGGGIVATVMSNLGLERFLGTRNMALVRTQVGDRYVLERMRADGFNLGGEQSGHIIMTDHATTGDGLMAALQALSAMIKVGKPASETFRAFEPVPQLLKNVRVGDVNAAMAAASVMKAIAAAEARLGKNGRILVRKSGTEPLIRVMAEGDDSDLVRTVVDQIIEAIPRQAA
ncbi:MAG: phosphoglucosamine mutase [Reyranella sp.]|uniref:phosphoglucosamine mutase n=1 Tax=Reyranella sp. TaxID=1929291 RepID=UPI0027313373|nr:phosphoglucosamine mutase [Reyranella sp.]MDP1961340.1 phosphoglucosamine mutase [Reyranella sp.]MDP2374670.1 phosphoglucosamine mutase [Reyranella sp.]